jgi:hypothetical protein
MVLRGKKGDSPQEFHKSVMPVMAYQKLFYVLNKILLKVSVATGDIWRQMC